MISLYGYAAPWKSAGLLRAAAARMRTPARIVLAGDFWDDPTQAGIDLRTSPSTNGGGQLVLAPGYLGPAERSVLVRTSTAGVFPYQPHPAFQGSGAIADYLAHAIPIIATDVANMAELIGPAGHLVTPNDPHALATALDNIAANTPHATSLRHAAQARAHRFTADAHAARCLDLYQRVINRSHGGH